MAATFDDRAVFEMFDMVSDEARAKHHDAIRNNNYSRYKGLTFWTPNIKLPPTTFEFFDQQSNTMLIKQGKYELLYGGSSDDSVLKITEILIK